MKSFLRLSWHFRASSRPNDLNGFALSPKTHNPTSARSFVSRSCKLDNYETHWRIYATRQPFNGACATALCVLVGFRLRPDHRGHIHLRLYCEIGPNIGSHYKSSLLKGKIRTWVLVKETPAQPQISGFEIPKKIQHLYKYKWITCNQINFVALKKNRKMISLYYTWASWLMWAY